jgi:hypothetical protein
MGAVSDASSNAELRHDLDAAGTHLAGQRSCNKPDCRHDVPHRRADSAVRPSLKIDERDIGRHGIPPVEPGEIYAISADFCALPAFWQDRRVARTASAVKVSNDGAGYDRVV